MPASRPSRYAVILAGGSGTRLWPWSRSRRPKQLLPMVRGTSLLRLAFDRLEGVVPRERRFVCAGLDLRDAICRDLAGLRESQLFGEPVGRDTAPAVGLCAATLARRDPEAVMAVCTADHVIEPQDAFRQKMAEAFALAEAHSDTLVMFGIPPAGPSTAYGYLEVGDPVNGALAVRRFCEKPGATDAQAYFAAGPDAYLWNSGMFVWRAATFLACLRRHQPDLHDAVQRIAAAYDTPQRDEVITRTYPALKKISVDYAVLEPASRDPHVRLAAVPLSLRWLDLGSWDAYAGLRDDESGSAEQQALMDCRRVLMVSDEPGHLLAAIGCEDLIIVHTADATLVCRAGQAERVKQFHGLLGERFAGKYL